MYTTGDIIGLNEWNIYIAGDMIELNEWNI